MEHQDSYGCRECSNGHNLLPLAGQRARCAGGPGPADGVRADAEGSLHADGSRLRGQGNQAIGARPGHDSGGAAKSNRIEPWEYDRALYKKRNEIERLFRRLKGFRRIFSRFEKLDVVFTAFLYFALIVSWVAESSILIQGKYSAA
jgi:transposase